MALKEIRDSPGTWVILTNKKEEKIKDKTAECQKAFDEAQNILL